jgi:hypothetical protein
MVACLLCLDAMNAREIVIRTRNAQPVCFANKEEFKMCPVVATTAIEIVPVLILASISVTESVATLRLLPLNGV